jgi:hypothetical protein
LVFAVVAPLFFLVGSRPPSGALRFIVSYTCLVYYEVPVL